MTKLKSIFIIVSILAIAAVGSYFGKQVYDDFTKPASADKSGVDWSILNK